MTRGITRAVDQGAIWREAADDDGFDTPELTSEPPAGAPKPPKEAPPPAAPLPSVTIPNSNKFKTPANGLKKLLDTIPTPDETTPKNSHSDLMNWLVNKPAFTGPYFKPGYADAIKATVGDDNYAKLLHHAPLAHVQALTTHQQKPAPNSNKFKTPSNGLKKLLEKPGTTTEHVQAWVASHPGYASGYLDNPEYQDAVKGHIGDKNYQELQKHLKGQTGNSAADQEQKSVADSGQQKAVSGVGLGDKLKSLNPGLTNTTVKYWNDLPAPKAKNAVEQMLQNGEGVGPISHEQLQSAYDAHFTKSVADSAAEAFGPAGFKPMTQEQALSTPTPPKVKEGPAAKANDVSKDILKAVPDFNTGIFKAMTGDQVKDKLKAHIDKLNNTGNSYDVDLANKLQGVYDKHFGDGEDLSAIKNEMGGPDPKAVVNHMQDLGLGSFPTDSPEKLKEYLTNWQGAATGQSLKKKLQEVLDTHYNKQAEPEMDQVSANQHSELLTNSQYNDEGMYDDLFKSPEFKQWWVKQSPDQQHQYINDSKAAVDDYGTDKAQQSEGQSQPDHPPSGSPGTVHPALQSGIQKVFPNADIEGMDDVALKAQMENWLKYLPEHEGYTGHVPQIQKLYDQFFGGKGQVPPNAPSPGQLPELSAKPTGADLAKKLLDQGWYYGDKDLKKLQKADPDQAQAILQDMAKKNEHGGGSNSAQDIYDQHYKPQDLEPADLGAGDEAYSTEEPDWLQGNPNAHKYQDYLKLPGAIPDDPVEAEADFNDWATHGGADKPKLDIPQETFGSEVPMMLMDGGYDAVAPYKWAPGVQAFLAEKGVTSPEYVKYVTLNGLDEQWHQLDPSEKAHYADQESDQGDISQMSKDISGDPWGSDVATPKQYTEQGGFLDDFNQAFPNNTISDELQGMDPAGQKAKVEALAPLYAPGGQYADAEQYAKVNKLLADHFGVTHPVNPNEFAEVMGKAHGINPDTIMGLHNKKYKDMNSAEIESELKGLFTVGGPEQQQAAKDLYQKFFGENENSQLDPLTLAQLKDTMSQQGYATDVKDYKAWESQLTPEKAQQYMDDPDQAHADFEHFLTNYYESDNYGEEEAPSGGKPTSLEDMVPKSDADKALFTQAMSESGIANKQTVDSWLKQQPVMWVSNIQSLEKGGGSPTMGKVWAKYKELKGWNDAPVGGADQPDSPLYQEATGLSASFDSLKDQILHTPAFKEWFHKLSPDAQQHFIDSHKAGGTTDYATVFKDGDEDAKAAYELAKQQAKEGIKVDSDKANAQVGAPVNPPWDQGAFANEYKEDFPGASWMNMSKYADPQEVKSKLEKLIAGGSNTWTDSEMANFKKHYDKWFGGGAPTTSAPIDHKSFIQSLVDAGKIDQGYVDLGNQTQDKFLENVEYVLSKPEYYPPDDGKWGTVAHEWQKAHSGGAVPVKPFAVKSFMNDLLDSGQVKSNYKGHANLSDKEFQENVDIVAKSMANGESTWNPNDKGWGTIAAQYNKMYGEGATPAAPAKPVVPWHWPSFGKAFKEVFPGSSWATDDLHTFEDAKAKLKPMVQTGLTDYPDSGKTKNALDLYEKYFGPYDGPGAPTGGNAAPASSVNSDTLFQEYADIFGKSPYTTTMYTNLGGHATPEHIKNYLQNKLDTGAFSGMKKPKVQALLDKYFGGGLSSLVNETFPEEPEEEPGVSAPFKQEAVNEDDLSNWAAAKPESNVDWKNFSSWWGKTATTPQQDAAIYHAWFPNKPNTTDEQASEWMQKVFGYHSKPSSGDLGAEGVPSWAHNSWAFGKKAEAEWPVFKMWAATHPGLPKNLSIKQKLGIWNGLSTADKAELKDNYMPDNPVDKDQVLAGLKAAYPDSDWSKWDAMPQGTLKNNIEMLAKAKYGPAVAAYNQFYGGNLPMPEVKEQGAEAEKPKVFTAPAIPESSWPEWMNNSYNGAAAAKTFNAINHIASAMGPEVQKTITEGDVSSPSYNKKPSALIKAWESLPNVYQNQLMHTPAQALPFHSLEEFAQWKDSLPKLADELAPILGQNEIDNNSYTFNKPTTGYGYTSQKNLVQNKLMTYAPGGPYSDPAKFQALLGVYNKWFGADTPTLAQTMSKIDPSKDWDSYLKKTPKDKVLKEMKKQLKAEPNPEKWVQLVDAFYKHFGGELTGFGVLTKYVGKNHPSGQPLKLSELQKLKYWKDKGGDPNAYVGGYAPEDYDYGPALTEMANQQKAGNFNHLQDYPNYYAWTPPNESGSGVGDYEIDPAMLGHNPAVSYTAPEKAKGGKQYTKMLEKAQSNTAAYSLSDQKTLASDEFQNWFENSSAAYKNAFQTNPGIALDDYHAFMQGSLAEQNVPEGFGDSKVYDVNPAAAIPKKHEKGISGPLPIHQTKNPERQNVHLEPAIIPDEQETIPGVNWAPKTAPMPIYRIVPNNVLNLDDTPVLSERWDNSPPAVKAIELEKQRTRLREIDRILNGPKAKRDLSKDMKYFDNWADSHGIDAKGKASLAGELFATQPTLNADEKWKHFEEWGKDHGVASQDLYSLADKLGIGNPGQAVPGTKGNYDHPDLANLILDYLENGRGGGTSPNGLGGIGIHWTRDKQKLYKGMDSASVGSDTMTNAGGRRIPIIFQGLWGGQGEDSAGTGGAYDVMNSQEREQTLENGAPVHLRRVQIRSEDGDWHDLIDYGPISEWTPGRDEHAGAGKGLPDKDSLGDRLDYDLGGKHDKEFWDKLRPGHQADAAFRKLIEQHPEKKDKIEKAYKHFFVGRPDLPTKAHVRYATYDPVAIIEAQLAALDDPVGGIEDTITRLAYFNDPADFDEEDEFDPDIEGGEDYSSPSTYGTPLFDSGHRPEMPGGHMYFSPHEVNPRPTSSARPEVEFDKADPGQDPLPGDWPHDNAPQTLYRGLNIDLSDPALGHVRRALFGPEYEQGDDQDYAKAHPQGYDDKTLGEHILDHIQNNPNSYDTPGRAGPAGRQYGMGPHWTKDRGQAATFAGMVSPSRPLNVPVRLKADWKGQGEDPYRSHTQGFWPSEKEVTMLPGSDMNVTGVEIMHPKTKKWHDVLDTPTHRSANVIPLRKSKGIVSVSERYL